MLLDPVTWGLAQRADDVLCAAGAELSGRCSAETHEAALELQTGVHATVGEAIDELRELRRTLAMHVQALGMAVGTCGAHPALMTEHTRVSPATRYQLIERTMRILARREPTFALHVHVGVPDAESAMRLYNRLRAHLPLLLALSASSPLWRGQSTGLASNRTILFQAFPRTGLPRRFDTYADWVGAVDTLVRSGAIPEATFLWWDIRPQPRLGTIEVRIMDAQPRLDAAASLAALVQALARLELEEGFASPELIGAQEVLCENRFLAARDGVAAELIDPVRMTRVPVARLVGELLDAARPHGEALGAGVELARVPRLLTAPEARREESLATSGGIPAVVADLAARFTGPELRHVGY